MDIMELGAIGELVGGVAVVATLIYLAAQVREGRRELRLQSEFSTTDRLAQAAFDYARFPHLARSLERMYTAPDLIDEEEKRAAMWINIAFFHGVDAMYQRYVEGLISKEVWVPQERLVTGILQSPLTRQWWATNQNLAFSDRFRSFIDHKLASASGSDHWEVATVTDPHPR